MTRYSNFSKKSSELELHNETAKHSGGKTGSKKVLGSDRKNYQLKPSIKDSSLIRKIKAGGVDRENFGEVIAASVSKAIICPNPEDTQLVPEVLLLCNNDTKKIQIASKYFDDVIDGTLNDYAQKSCGVSIKKGSYIRISAKQDTKPGVLDISSDDRSQIRKDLADAIALSCLSGDHDVNPGNMVVTKDKYDQVRIARIDFGHAFNDLLGAPKAFGGQIRNKDNRALDFLNREPISHLLPSHQKSKLWKSYGGLVPSEELANSFRKIGESQNMKDGLDQAKQSFIESANYFKNNGTTKDIQHLKKSLASIVNGLGGEEINIKQQPDKIIEQVFNKLDTFYTENQKQMLDVAKLMDMQVKIDNMLIKGSPEEQQIAEMKKTYLELKEIKGIKSGKDGIEWIKSEKDSPAFKGNLDEFLIKRRKDLGLSANVNIKKSELSNKEKDGLVRNTQSTQVTLPSINKSDKSNEINAMRSTLKAQESKSVGPLPRKNAAYKIGI
jgi:hypothetical protein